MSEHIFEQRLTKLKTALAEADVDGMWISNLTNVRYISGYTGSAGSCLVLGDTHAFFTDGRYIEQSKREVKGFDRYIDTSSHIKSASTNNLIPDGTKLAFEADFVSINLFKTFRDLFSNVNWETSSRMIEEIASIKDEAEIAALRTAAEITDKTYQEVLELIRPGVTEKTIANELAYRYRKYGDGESYPPIVASGPNSALPHAVPSDREFQNGDFIVIDAAAQYAGYHADMTRTPLVGKATERHREVYDIVQRSQKAGVDGVKAGMSCKDADALTRDVIETAGYGEAFSHGTGHGIGLEIHTLPRLSALSKDVLKENNVVTIEPGIYFPGWGGVRIEDDVVIKKDGGEILNKTTKDLIEL